MTISESCIHDCQNCWKTKLLTQRWIPVTERLPEESDGTVLVCFPDIKPYNLKEPFVNAKHDRRVCTGTYSQHSKCWYIGEMNAVGGDDPVFWMPLPEPPKEEK